MICGRCGHKLAESTSVCMRCRVAFPNAVTEARKTRYSRQKTKLLIRTVLVGVFAGLVLALGARFVLKAEFAGVALSAIVGIGGSTAIIHLPKWTLGAFYRMRLAKVRHAYDLHFDRAINRYQKRLEKNEQDPEAHHELGLAFLFNHDYQRAIHHLEQAAGLTDDPAPLQNHLGVALHSQRNTIAAMEAWKRSIEVLPEYAPAHFNRALSLVGVKNYDKAVKAFEETLMDDPAGAGRRLPVQLGNMLFQQGDLEGAIREFQRMVENEPDSGDAHNNLGVTCYRFGETVKGFGELTAALRVDPGHARAQCNVGMVQFLEGSAEDALGNLRRARQMEPTSPQIHAYLGLALYRNGQIAAGIRELETAAKITGADVDLRYNLGQTYISEGEIERGVDQLKQALAMEPMDVDALIHLGGAYFIRDKHSEAEQIFRKVLQNDPYNVFALNDLAQMLIEMERIPEAMPLLQRAREVADNIAEVHFNQGYALQLQEDFMDAAMHYKTASSLKRELIPAHLNRGLCFLMDSQWNAAVAEFEHTLSLDKSVLAVHGPLGSAYQSKNDMAGALHHWEIALQWDVKNPDLYTNVGLVYYLRNNPDKAIDHFQRAMRLREGGRDDDYNNLALAFIKKGATEAAIRNFERSIAVNPANPVTHSNLGLAYFFDNQPERALGEWTRVAALDPNYARRRGNIETATYDDTQMAFIPCNWRQNALRLAPLTTPPRFRLLLGYNYNPWWVEPKDPDVEALPGLQKELERWERAVRTPK